ncbi:class I SAM-dependent methyltransferase [Gemmatimonas groenlandica]|uniref:Class I SAM-dependent methyltransferase n=1 Tax=Gemmatimonas groenlandica TaxID=2732249 RepID=A0A6M4ITD7_9BACT|nr:class I SAM-dependent methyltransferase [Gemmatimonas groenlandica]QJR36746.1 class I SAM-dependent methyltransferase [Gemmatimonas groenlandica]
MSTGDSTSAAGDFVPAPPASPLLDERLRDSWDANATAWTLAVREQRIPSRRAGTDAAIVAAIESVCAGRASLRVLDVGCGEGWLARAIANPSRDVLGIDGSAGLIAHACAIPMPGVRYDTVSYEAIIADAAADAAAEGDAQAVAGPWDLIVCNFALLGDPLSPLLAALARRLTPDGSLLIQTVHPWNAMGDGPYTCGWREEQFQGFGVTFPDAMPWYFRTLASWHQELDDAGLRIRALHEPLHPETRRPLSLLLRCDRRR